MASQRDIEQIYDVFSELVRLSLGENFDYTCAFYNGNYSQTLEQAQKAKDDYILTSIGFKTISVDTSSSDYIQTTKEWTKYGNKLGMPKIWAAIKLIPRYVTNKNFRYQIECLRRSSFTTLYKRGVMYLTRVVFEKT